MSTRRPGKPLISVVTPLFNCLERTLAMVSSLRESMPASVSYEIILVDDGSSDATRPWLTTLGPPFRVVLNEGNLGFGAATNRGAALAEGSILALLNNDLILRKGWLRPMLRTLNSLGRKGGLVGNVQVNAATFELDHAGIVTNLKGKPEHSRRPPGLLRRWLRPARPVFALTGACVLIRTETWKGLGGFDEVYMNGCEDVDLCLRASAAGLINAVALRSQVLHHVSSSPGRKLRDEENTRRLVLRWRHELAVSSSRLWTRGYFGKVIEDPRDFPDTAEAWRMAFYLLHLRTVPPATAVAAMGQHIDQELAHWREMFSD